MALTSQMEPNRLVADPVIGTDGPTRGYADSFPCLEFVIPNVLLTKMMPPNQNPKYVTGSVLR